MSELSGKVIVANLCVDPRFYSDSEVLIGIFEGIKKKTGADFICPRTAAGPEGRILQNDHHLEAMVEDDLLLIEAKGADTVAIIGHDDCAGHPLDSLETRFADLLKARDMMRSRLPEHVTVLAFVLVQADGKFWRLNEVKERQAVAA